MRRRWSLRLRITAAVAVGLSVVVTVLGLYGVQVLHESKRRLLGERMITARALAERLDDALLATIRHLGGVAASPELRRMAARADGAAWDDMAARVPFATYGVYLLDARGDIAQAGSRLIEDRGRSMRSHAAVAQVLAGSRVAISGLLDAPRTRTPIVLICVAADPGALCAAVDLTQLPFDRYISGVQLGETGHAVIVDAGGRVLASTDADDRFEADEHPDFHSDLIARREARVGPATYYQGDTPVEQHIMAFAPLRAASWGVSFGQTEAETLAPVALMRARMLSFGLFALLAALAFAWWDTGTVIRPLRHLADHARRIAGGDLSGAAPIARRDELGELAEGFEVMRTRLRALLGDLTRREAEAQALYEVSREVLARTDLQGVLRSIAEHARHLLGADVAVICLAGGRWQGEPAAASGPDDAVIRGAPPVPLCDEREGVERRAPVAGCPVLNPAFTRSHAVAALRLDGAAQGALCVGSRAAAVFEARSNGLLDGLANLAAIALRSAELHEQLHHLAVLAERERIGRDLHDSTLQSLYGIALTLESARAALETDPGAAVARIEQGLVAMSRAADEIRGFVHRLHAVGPAGDSLTEVLAAIVGEVNAGGIIPVTLSMHDGSADLPEPGGRAHVALIVREALANAVRHSQAARAEVVLSTDAHAIRIAVLDDGRGFDAESPRGRGLANMAARAAAIGGRLTISSAPSRGTSIELVVPRHDAKGADLGDETHAPAHR